MILRLFFFKLFFFTAFWREIRKLFREASTYEWKRVARPGPIDFTSRRITEIRTRIHRLSFRLSLFSLAFVVFAVRRPITSNIIARLSKRRGGEYGFKIGGEFKIEMMKMVERLQIDCRLFLDNVFFFFFFLNQLD